MLTKIRELYRSTCLRLALFLVRFLLAMGFGSSEILGEVVQTVIKPLESRIEELTLKIEGLERALIGRSPSPGRPPILLTPDVIRRDSIRSSLEEGEIIEEPSEISSCQSPSKSPVPYDGYLERASPTLPQTCPNMSQSSSTDGHQCNMSSTAYDGYQELDRASTLSDHASYDSAMDSRYDSAEDSKSRGSSPLKLLAPTLDPLQEASSSPLFPAPTPIPNLSLSDYVSLFEQEPSRACQVWVESVDSGEYLTDPQVSIDLTPSEAGDLVSWSPVPVVAETDPLQADQPSSDLQPDRTPSPAKPPPQFVTPPPPPLVAEKPPKSPRQKPPLHRGKTMMERSPSVEELVSKFETFEHIPLKSETANSKRAILARRRKNRSPEKQESFQETVTSSSLERVTNDIDSLSPFPSALWDELGSGEKGADSFDIPGGSLEVVDHHEDNLEVVDHDTELPVIQAELVGTDYQVHDQGPEYRAHEGPDPGMFSTSPQPDSLPPSPDPHPLPTNSSRYSLHRDSNLSSELEEAENKRSRKKTRRFSVSNIIKRFDSGSDSDAWPRSKNSPSPIGGLFKKLKGKKSRPESCPPMPTSPSNESLGSATYRDIISSPRSEVVRSELNSADRTAHKPPSGFVKKMKRRLSRSQSISKMAPLSSSETDVSAPPAPSKSRRFSVQTFIRQMKSPSKKDYTSLIEPDHHRPIEISAPIVQSTAMFAPIVPGPALFEQGELIESEGEQVAEDWAKFEEAFNNRSHENSPILGSTRPRRGSVTSTSSNKPPLPPPSPSTAKRRTSRPSSEGRLPPYAPCMMPERVPRIPAQDQRALHRAPSIEQIISKFENSYLDSHVCQIAAEMRDNHQFQKAILDIIVEEGYGMVRQRQGPNESPTLVRRGAPISHLVTEAREVSQLDLDYLSTVSEHDVIPDSVLVEGLRGLVEGYHGERKLFLCSFISHITTSLENSEPINAATIRQAYRATISHFKSTSDAIDALSAAPARVATVNNTQNRIVQTLIDALMSVSFHALWEKGREERYTRNVVRELLRKDFKERIQRYRRVRFIASVQIKKGLNDYFRDYLALQPPRNKFKPPSISRSISPEKLVTRNTSPVTQQSLATPQRESLTTSPAVPTTRQSSPVPTTQIPGKPPRPQVFTRRGTKVFKNKAKRIEEFKTSSTIKLCLSNMFLGMLEQYRQRKATRDFHFREICSAVISSIATQSQFDELVSLVLQDLIAGYLFGRLAQIRKIPEGVVQSSVPCLGKLETFYSRKERGTEVVERVCYSRSSGYDSAAEMCSITADYGVSEVTMTTSPTQQFYKEYTTSTTQIVPGDFDPTPTQSLTSLLTEFASTQTDITETHPPPPHIVENNTRQEAVSNEQDRNCIRQEQETIRKRFRRRRNLVARSRSFDSAIGDDSVVSSECQSVVSAARVSSECHSVVSTARISSEHKPTQTAALNRTAVTPPSDIHIAKSPFNVSVKTPFNPSSVLATGPGLMHGIVGKISLFEVDCRSAGNGPLDIAVEDDDHNLVPVKVRETQPNCYDVSFIPKTPIPHFVNIKWNDFNIKGSPFKVMVMPRPEKDINLGGEGKIRVYYSTTTSSEKIRHNCRFLQSLLERKKVHLREDFEPWIPIDIGMDREERNRIFEKAGVRKTPMLFIDDQYVGDFDDVVELDETGELDRLLSYCALKYRNLQTVEEARRVDQVARMQQS
eukprot:sb/3460719/